MSNKVLALWVVLGVILVVLLFRCAQVIRKQKVEIEQLKFDKSNLLNRNGSLVLENSELR